MISTAPLRDSAALILTVTYKGKIKTYPEISRDVFQTIRFDMKLKLKKETTLEAPESRIQVSKGDIF